MSQETGNVVVDRNRDCFSCKLVSGSGLIGSGLYVLYHSKNFQKIIGKSVMFSIGCVMMTLGTARILDLPPFSHQSNENDI